MRPTMGSLAHRSVGRGLALGSGARRPGQFVGEIAGVSRITSSTTASASHSILPICARCCRLFSTTPPAGAASNTRWKARQGKDQFAREAKVRGLKSRAAFKLLEMDARYRLFKPGQTVVDLGYAPGSWSQVAVERTKPAGRVLGIDLIPAQPPRGVSTIQGNFLAPTVRQMVKDFLARTPAPAKVPKTLQTPASSTHAPGGTSTDTDAENELLNSDELTEEEIEEARSSSLSSEQRTVADVVVDRPSYLEMERQASAHTPSAEAAAIAADIAAEESSQEPVAAPTGGRGRRMVDVVLSDMSEPWPQTYGFWLNTLSNPYNRMMNTSGNTFRDHAGSMDLCHAALEFASDTLRPGGHFVCKFYQGGEDKILEKRLKKMFAKVVREKPESSRSVSL
ncbi:2' O-ribose methyltransferase [Sporothrix eucalyptigena]|uniref:rRNA methyltransferase 2, mitochondrial n=1 Tax=Sporothrix eucalyptigena TaxID=1812306 RepID=A0ABP0ANT3_9PEZI